MKTDILIIGSGIAGLNFALQAAKFCKVMVVTKKKIKESNTYYAQGGIAAVLDPLDSFKRHVDDTLRAGDGLCNRKAVEILVKNAPREIKKLIDFGVDFCEDQEGNIALTREGCHTRNRIAYTHDVTGKEIEKALVAKIKENKKIEVIENATAVDLIADSESCKGAYVLINGKVAGVFAKAVVLATGGIGRLFANTSNPQIATGDGIAIAYRAGAKLQDMEFVQFHPTLFYKGKGEHFLISETLRGEGGVLRSCGNRTFMKKYHKSAELAPRDVVARAITHEIAKCGTVYLDMTHKDAAYLRKRFPNIYKKCRQHGIDMTKQMIPVAPGAHYLCGGVKVNTYGESSVKGLYAIGEAACTGVNGADRLGSNSMMEGLVFGDRALKNVFRYIKNKKIQTIKTQITKKISTRPEPRLRKKLQRLMCDNVGIIRRTYSMQSALEQLSKMEAKAKSLELQNMILVAKLITKAALIRKESRGTHFVRQYPKKSSKWKRHVVL